jgi:hypothetical protein
MRAEVLDASRCGHSFFSARPRRHSSCCANAAGGARSEGLRAGQRALERRADPRCDACRIGLLRRCGGAAAEWRNGSRQGGIEAFWKQQFSSGFNAVDGGSNGLSTSGDLGFEWGSATFEVASGSATVTDVTKYVNVLKKDASGSWKIAMTIWTSSRPR